MPKPVDRKSPEWSQKLLLGPLLTVDVSKWKDPFHHQKSAVRRNTPNEKAKPISLAHQNNLKGFTFKIVLFDDDLICFVLSPPSPFPHPLNPPMSPYYNCINLAKNFFANFSSCNDLISPVAFAPAPPLLL